MQAARVTDLFVKCHLKLHIDITLHYFCGFLSHDAVLALIVATALCLCLLQVSVLLKRLNVSSWLLASELPSRRQWWRLLREKTPHRASPCKELELSYDIKLVFVQKITFGLGKINKNCCHQSCTF